MMQQGRPYLEERSASETLPPAQLDQLRRAWRAGKLQVAVIPGEWRDWKEHFPDDHEPGFLLRAAQYRVFPLPRETQSFIDGVKDRALNQPPEPPTTSQPEPENLPGLNVGPSGNLAAQSLSDWSPIETVAQKRRERGEPVPKLEELWLQRGNLDELMLGRTLLLRSESQHDVVVVPHPSLIQMGKELMEERTRVPAATIGWRTLALLIAGKTVSLLRPRCVLIPDDEVKRNALQVGDAIGEVDAEECVST